MRPYNPIASERESEFSHRLYGLHTHHLVHSPEYSNICKSLYSNMNENSRLDDYPPIPVSLFKYLRLSSISQDDVFREVKSSGTSGNPSLVVLDKETARLQTAALANILTVWLGRERRPMILVESPQLPGQVGQQSAGSAAVSAMMMFGKDHFWLLDESGNPNVRELVDWLSTHGGHKPVIFGFTFKVFQSFLQNEDLLSIGRALEGATVIHGGGWKKLEDLAVSNEDFRTSMQNSYGISEVRDYYGMAEQLGGIWVEGQNSVLIPSTYSSVVIRDPDTLKPVPMGEAGLIHSFSTLPLSYPGHSLLTDDIGVLVENSFLPEEFGEVGLRVLSRLPAAEPRGCSDATGAVAR